MKRNVSVECVFSRCNILISGKIIKEMPGSVANGTPCMSRVTLIINTGYFPKYYSRLVLITNTT